MGIFEIADTGGMICGFRLRADGPAQDVQWNVEAAPQTFPEMEGGPLWLHFNLVDSRAERWIAENPRIPEQARERLVISGRRHPLQSSDRLRHELRAGEVVASPLQWLSHLVLHMGETFGGAVG